MADYFANLRYQVTRPSLQLGKSRWDEVEGSCDRLMALVTSTLNDERQVLGHSSHDLPALIGAVAECAKQFPKSKNWRFRCFLYFVFAC